LTSEVLVSIYILRQKTRPPHDG
ncbi:DUF454 domain-containing protein, partial [Pseudomonas aeruginosa]